jgi:hypothetical protein
MDRIKRSPGAWGLAIGGVVIAVSTLLVWFDYANASAGTSAHLRAFDAVTGQTVMLMGTLVAICGLGVAASSGGGRFLWGGLGLLMAGLVFAGTIWAIVDPESFSSNLATTQALSRLALPGSIESASDAASEAFDDGTITVAVQIGVWIALLGGLVGTLGGILSFRKKRPAEE